MIQPAPTEHLLPVVRNKRILAMEKKLLIEGLTCQMCVKRVKKIIEQQCGATDVVISLEHKEAVFNLADGAALSPIVAAINNFGFTVREK